MIKFNVKGGLKLQEYLKKAGIYKYQSKEADFKAKSAMGMQFLEWILEGSPNEKATPPVKDTILRGSGGVHVGQKHIGGSTKYDASERNLTLKENVTTVTIGLNAPYAVYQHEMLQPEGTWKPGLISQQYQGVEGKFVEKHVLHDNNAAIEKYTEIFKKETGG